MSSCVICIFLNMTYKSHRIAFETNTIAYNTIAYYKVLIRHNIEYGMI